MIFLEVNGQRFEGFTRITAERSYMSVPASFSFVATTNPDNVTGFPIAEGDACRVMIDELPFITGFVDQIEVNHSDNAHEIAVQGRSLIADLVDSSMNGDYEINGPIPLKTALENIISKAGVSGISVIDETDGVDGFTDGENLSGKIGSPVWEFMVTLAIKKQVLLTEDGQGNVIMTRGDGETISDQLIKEPNGQGNNIKDSTCRRATRQRFNSYTVLSQDDSASLANLSLDDFEGADTTDKEGTASDTSIRSSRFQCIMAEKASTPEECTQRAVWQSNYNRVRAFSYQCTVQGFATDNGQPFEPGMMPHIIDSYMQIDSDLIIDKVLMTYSETQGSNSKINFLLPDAFTLTASEPQFDESGNDLTGIFS